MPDMSSRRQQGAAMTGAGTVLAGTGLLAGGVPGAPEPRTEYMDGHLRGHGAKEMMSRGNRLHNLRAGKSMPRAGILGFRAAAHQHVLNDLNSHLPYKGEGKKTKYWGEPSNNYHRAHLEAKISEEKKVLLGMRKARKATYGLTLGGAALALAGNRRKKSTLVKRDQRQGSTSGTALGAGASLATVGHVVPKGLDRFGSQYKRRAIAHTEEARDLAPHFGGVKTNPERVNGKKNRKTMEMERPDWHIRQHHAYNDIEGGPNSVRAQQVATLRGQAAQEKHFAEVFHNTSRAFRRARTPGLVLGAAGAGGLLASRRREPVAKLSGYDYTDKQHGYTWTERVGHANGEAVWRHNPTKGQPFHTTNDGTTPFKGRYSAFAGKGKGKVDLKADPTGVTRYTSAVAKLSPGALARHSPHGVAYGAAILGTSNTIGSKKGDGAEGTAAAAGALVGQGAYQGGGKLAARQNDRYSRSKAALKRSGMSGNQRDKKIDAHFAEHGLPGARKKHVHDAAERYREAFRNYPHELPGAKVKRVLAHTHAGRSGDAIGGAVTVTGGLLGMKLHSDRKKRPVKKADEDYGMTSQLRRAEAAGTRAKEHLEQGHLRRAGYHVGRATRHELVHVGLESDRNAVDLLGDLRNGKKAVGPYFLGRHRNKLMAAAAAPALVMAGRASRREKVGKSREYGYMERKRSAFRTAELGVGLGVGAWGASRLHVGPGIARGVKLAAGRHASTSQVDSMVRHGQNLRSATQRGTGRAERVLRDRIPGFGTALDSVPAKLRPGAATAGGALLAARAVPTHDERFTPTGSF